VEDDGKSFLKLIIKVKKKIVADGLADDAFDVTNVGRTSTRRPSTGRWRKVHW
jgi:predicted sulfurtransferase